MGQRFATGLRAKRFFRSASVAALVALMLLSFAPPVVNAAATSSSPAGQISPAIVAHEQIAHEYSLSTLSQGPSQSSKKVVILARNQDGPVPMTLFGGYVYFYDADSGQVNRVPESGGKVQTLTTIGPGFATVGGLAVEGHRLYWTYLVNGTFWLYKTDLSTDKTITLYTTWAKGLVNIGPFAVSGDHVYFVLWPNIYSIMTNGSNIQVIAKAPSLCPLGDTFSGGVVYWNDACTGQVGSVPASGGTAKLLSPKLSSNGGIAAPVTQMIVVGGRLYWTFNGMTNSSVDTVSTSGKGFKMLYSTDDENYSFGGVTFWQGKVIFVDLASTTIASVPRDGGPLQVIVHYPTDAVEVLGGTIYLTSWDDSTVARTPA